MVFLVPMEQVLFVDFRNFLILLGYENSKNHEIRAYRANGKTYYRLQQKLNRRSG